MRKITAIFLALAILVLFTSCVGDDSNTTTNPPISTGISPYQSGETSSNYYESTDATSVQSVTYVLTTSPNKTVPWSETTRFEVEQMIPTGTVPSSYQDPNLVVSSIDRPSVNMSSVTPSDNSQSQSSSDITSSTTTTKPTTTQSIKKTPKSMDVTSFSYNSDRGTISLSVSLDGWNGNFETASKNISILIDGEKIDTTVPCKVTSTIDADGGQIVIIDVSTLSISSGSNITYTIPAGLLVTKTGSQYNTSYTGTAPIY